MHRLALARPLLRHALLLDELPVRSARAATSREPGWHCSHALLPKGKEGSHLLIARVRVSHGSALQCRRRLQHLPCLGCLLLRSRRLQLMELVPHVEVLEDVVDGQHVRADADSLERLAREALVPDRVALA